MYYSVKNSYLNIILSVVVFLAILVFVSWLAYNTGRSVAEHDKIPETKQKVITEGVDVPLTPISLAQNAQLHESTGLARVGIVGGKVEISVVLAKEAELPEGTVMTGWLVDAGKLGGIGKTSVSEDDQLYGTPFANIDFSEKVNDAPFAMYMGNLKLDDLKENYYLFYEINDILTPYDAVMITLESDGNRGNYDPRPGTPVMIGEIK